MSWWQFALVLATVPSTVGVLVAWILWRVTAPPEVAADPAQAPE
jgi:hypothetical protein